ncbi:MAG: hypothetical protein JSS22_17950 [Proteobacteria bacterium]|nr:hypothetical protein [Pseudomonadota bacterium]
MTSYHRYARSSDLYLIYVVINSQADRSKSAAEQADPFLTVGAVGRGAEGMSIRGTKWLATGGGVVTRRETRR